MKAALAKHPGDVVSLEAELEKGKPTYEFDIKTKDGKEWVAIIKVKYKL
jgi:uncharacterized membrane protein YkoI